MKFLFTLSILLGLSIAPTTILNAGFQNPTTDSLYKESVEKLSPIPEPPSGSVVYTFLLRYPEGAQIQTAFLQLSVATEGLDGDSLVSVIDASASHHLFVCVEFLSGRRLAMTRRVCTKDLSDMILTIGKMEFFSLPEGKSVFEPSIGPLVTSGSKKSVFGIREFNGKAIRVYRHLQPLDCTPADVVYNAVDVEVRKMIEE